MARRPIAVPGPNGTMIFVDPDTLEAGENPPPLPAGENPPPIQTVPEAAEALTSNFNPEVVDHLWQTGIEPPLPPDPTARPTVPEAAGALVDVAAPDVANHLNQVGIQPPPAALTPEQQATANAFSPQMTRGPDGQPVFTEPGQGPLSNQANALGVGGPGGVRQGELSQGAPQALTQTPERAQIIQHLQNMGLSQPQVTTDANGTPSVGGSRSRPVLTEEQRATLTEKEKVAWDDPGVDDASMVALMEQQARGIDDMGQTTQSAQEEIAAARAAHEQQLDDSATEIRQAMEETIAETQRMQDDMQSRVDSLYSQRFDPRRIFSSPDAAASFSLHTGYAMGAMLQSLQATNFIGSNPVNVASRVIDQVIEADIARQREAFRRGEGEVNQGFAAIEARRQLGVSEVEALEFSRSSAEEEVAQQMARIAAQYQGTHAGQVAEQASNQYRLAAMGRRRALNQTAMALASSQAAALAQARGRGRRAAPAEETGGLSYYMNVIPAESRTPRQNANYQDYLALTPSQRDTVRARTTAVGRALQLTDRLIHVLNTEGGAVQVNPAMRGRVGGLQAALTSAIKKAEEMGALDNGVLELVDRLVGSHDDIFHLTEEDASRLMTYRHERTLELRIIAEETGQSTSQERLAQNVESTQTQMGSHTETANGGGNDSISDAVTPPFTAPVGPSANPITNMVAQWAARADPLDAQEESPDFFETLARGASRLIR